MKIVRGGPVVTKTDGVTTATAGGSLTYTIVASNAGPSSVTGATVADSFPGVLTCTWTCVGADGGTCIAAGSGNINDTVNLPVAGSVTYSAACTISPSATGSLISIATVTAPAGVTDPSPTNNSATDTDTLVPLAGAAVAGTKTVTGTFAVGATVTYTVTLTNPGPGAQGDNLGNEFTDLLTGSLALVSATATATSGTALVEVIEVARMAPSNFNTQPWRVHVLAGAAKRALSEAISRVHSANTHPPFSPFPNPPHRSAPRGWTTLGGVTTRRSASTARTWHLERARPAATSGSSMRQSGSSSPSIPH